MNNILTAKFDSDEEDDDYIPAEGALFSLNSFRQRAA